jgi:tRNA A-37 threonylcarbamoyl transferase component Bud32
MPAAVDPLPGNGRPIGRYEPIRRLAVGGMAEIYLARLLGVGIEGFEKLVVLKRILPQHALDPELLRMFLDEARLSATLTHPHVTEVYDVGADGEAPFFAMEYVHGANLRELMRAHARVAGTATAPLELAYAIGIVAAAADGLHYAHDRLGPRGEPLGIVHRDVSPSNVLVSYDGAVKVSDFGIAKWAFQRTRTQEGTLKGKFAYMSPEQCRGRAVDRRSDVFALGTILYELTTGGPPFSGDSDLEILNRIATGVAPPPAWPEDKGPYPPALAAIVMRALAPAPDQRFPTMEAFQLALETFAREASLPVSTVALGALMQRLFADELAAWQEAQRAGKSLGEHLAARPAPIHPNDPGERTATDAFGPTRRRARAGERRVRALGLVAFAAVFALAGGFAAKAWVSHQTARPGAPAAIVSPASATPAAPPRPITPPPGPPPATKIVADAVTPAPADSPSARVRRAKRARVEAAPPAAPVSRLRTWDPDSPKPP